MIDSHMGLSNLGVRVLGMVLQRPLVLVLDKGQVETELSTTCNTFYCLKNSAFGRYITYKTDNLLRKSILLSVFSMFSWYGSCVLSLFRLFCFYFCSCLFFCFFFLYIDYFSFLLSRTADASYFHKWFFI